MLRAGILRLDDNEPNTDPGATKVVRGLGEVRPLGNILQWRVRGAVMNLLCFHLISHIVSAIHITAFERRNCFYDS